MSIPLPRGQRREPDGVPPTKGSRWDRFARYAVAYYGGVCHLCDHGGAKQADHLKSVADHPELAWTLTNIRPAHGAPGNRCPVCHQNCNQLRGPMSVERARRVIAERAAAGQGAPAAQPRPKPEPGAGREW
jgi:5-methylcytosine-specific restriction endonuclease McrA